MLFLTVLSFNLIGDWLARRFDIRRCCDLMGESSEPGTPLLDVVDLVTQFRTPRGIVRAVDEVSLSVQRGEALGIVGESGSGKTVLSRSIMGLLSGPEVVRSGSVSFDGRELVGRTDAELRGVWGTGMAMVFQDPAGSLNPLMRVEEQIAEPLRARLGMTPSRRPGDGDAACSATSASPTPNGEPASTRTSCPAACVSG